MADVPFLSWGFKATGSTTNRNMPDRLREIKNVRDYGAVGDGVTNDQPAIQAAVNDVNPPYSTSKRGIIFFPPGIYQLNSSVTYEAADGINYIGFVGVPGAVIRGNFADALLKRSPNAGIGPVGDVYFIEGLRVENTHAAGKGITFHCIVGGSIRNCSVSAYIAIETYNSQSVSIQDCTVGSGGIVGAGLAIGIVAGNATSIISTDVMGTATGIQHSNLGLTIHGGRIEVCTTGIVLGKDASGTNLASSSVDISGISMESNKTSIHIYNCVSGRISANATAGEAGIVCGYRVGNCNDMVIESCTLGSSLGYSQGAIWFDSGGTIARVTFNSVKAIDGGGAPSWIIPAGIDSFSLTNCNIELNVSQLPVAAIVGTVLPVKDATATTPGTTVAGGGSNHVAVVRSAGVWRII